MAPAKIGVGANLLSKKLQLKPRLCKFLGVPLVSPRGDIPLLISKFLKLYQPQSTGIRKHRIWEENLKAMLHGKDGVGMPETRPKWIGPDRFSKVFLILDSSSKALCISDFDIPSESDEPTNTAAGVWPLS